MSGPKRYRLLTPSHNMIEDPEGYWMGRDDYETVVRERDDYSRAMMTEEREKNELRRVLDEAPHDVRCGWIRFEPCNCFKSRLPRAEPPKTERKFVGPGHLEQTGYCTAGDSVARAVDTPRHSAQGQKILNDPDDEPTAGDGK